MRFPISSNLVLGAFLLAWLVVYVLVDHVLVKAGTAVAVAAAGAWFLVLAFRLRRDGPRARQALAFALMFVSFALSFLPILPRPFPGSLGDALETGRLVLIFTAMFLMTPKEKWHEPIRLRPRRGE